MPGYMKKILSFALIGILLCAGLPPVSFAQEKPAFTLGVTAFGQSVGTAVNLWFDEEAGCMRLFLPAQCDLSALSVRFTGAKSVSVDAKELANGAPTNVFSVGEHKLRCDGREYPLTVLQSAGLPSVFITTASGSLDAIRGDQNHKEAGSITVMENGRAAIENAALKSVKGRGNSTWNADKKPYNIKFEKKTDVLGMGKAKKWSLLANHFDASLLRNAVALDLAAAFGLPFTPDYRMVDLYANGEYQGNYLIVESVEIGDTRVAINDLEAANEAANPGTDVEKAETKTETVDGRADALMWADIAAPQDITGGYLLETEFPDRYRDEVSGFITENGQHVVLKSPEYAARAEVAYISDFYGEMERALYAPNGRNAAGKHYTDYFDMAQLVKMYILTEYTFHRDAGMSSCYFYKDAGESVLHAGPAWDFDLSLGNDRYKGGLPFDVKNAESWWANAGFFHNTEEKTQTVFTLLYRHEDFRAQVAKQWPALAKRIDAALAALPRRTDAAAPSAVMNAFRWNLLEGKTPAEKEASYRAEAQALRQFAALRRAALNKGFGENAAMVYYDANGGSGRVFNGAMLSVGEEAILRETNHDVTPVLAPEGCEFAGWSTRPDGSGKLWQPGDRVRVTEKTTVFYAVWQPKGGVVPPPPTAADADYALGDIDLDGRVTAADARLSLRAAVQLETLDAVLLQVADVDGDRSVSSADARLILRAVVQLEDLPPQSVFVPAGHARLY